METIAVFTTDGRLTRVKKSHDLLAQLQHACGGFVQAVSMTGTLDMWCNEEGKFNGSDYNECATAVWHAIYGATDTIFGTVVFTGTPDANGDTQGITDEDFVRLEYVARAYMNSVAAGSAG